MQCYSQAQIAQELGITQGAVSQILKRVTARLAEQYANGAAQMLIEQAEQLMRIAQEALAAYQQSKAPTKSPAAPPVCPNPTTEEPPINHNPNPSPNPASEEQQKDPPDYRQEISPFPVSEANGIGVFSAAPRSGGKPESGGGGLGTAAFLRIAIQALAAAQAIRATFQPEQTPCDDNVKMIVGIDLDHMKYKNGDPVQRKEVDRLIALNQG